MRWELAILAGAYLLGSIPSALLVVWMLSGRDVRREGSGNVGAANATRVAGYGAGAIVTLADVAKGVLPMWAMWYLNPASWWLAATLLTAVLGHCYPVWLRFRGGKGVATAFGAFLVLAWKPALVALAVWCAVLAIGKRVSLASLVATAVFPVLLALLDSPGRVMLGAVSLTAVLIIVRHHTNIRQLIDGSESRIGGE